MLNYIDYVNKVPKMNYELTTYLAKVKSYVIFCTQSNTIKIQINTFCIFQIINQ